MLAGHYATALIAKQQAPRGHLAWYLVAAQLPDLLWQLFHFVGLEPTTPDNPMLVSLDNLTADMTYSHDVLPTLGWIGVAVVVGRLLTGAWRPAVASGALVLAHALCDYVIGYPHHVFGPESPSVGTASYTWAPYLSVVAEAVFTLGVMAVVVRHDRKHGVRRSRATWAAWVGVLGGGLLFTLVSADLSLVEATGLEPIDALSGLAVPFLVTTYVGMILGMAWTGREPTLAG